MTDNHGNISIKGIIIILSLFLFSAALIGIGAYYSYSSSPKKIFKIKRSEPTKNSDGTSIPSQGFSINDNYIYELSGSDGELPKR